mgnify:CR=1 FL=1
MTHGERLRLLRGHVEGLTALELSQLAGLSHGYVALVESGERSLGHKSAIGLARALGVSIDWLLIGRGTEPRPKTVRDAVEAARRSTGGEAA